MGRLSKRKQAIVERLAGVGPLPVEEAFALLKDLPQGKFDESVDVSINLGIEARKTDQNVRGATVMPNGVGKDVRVAVFAQGDAADAATAAGAG